MTEVTLLHGNCLDLMPTFAASSVAMVFADLPYGILDAQKHWDKKVCIASLCSQLQNICSDHAIQVFTCNISLASALIVHNQRPLKYDLVWHKRPTGAVNAPLRQMRTHENIVVFGTTKSPYFPQMVLRDKPRTINGKNGSSRNYNERYRGELGTRVLTHKHPTSVFYASQENSGHHPTQKPVALLEWLIKTYTNPGDTVLDPVAGSGTTAIAAMRTGRNVICIEQDAEYFAVMQKRVADERARMKAA